MSTTKIIRRTIGIAALVMWVVAVVPLVCFGHGDHWVWHLDSWAFFVAPILTAIYAVMLVAHFAKGKHRTAKLAAGFGSILLIIVFSVFAIVKIGNLDHKVWGNNEYAVYNEFGGFFAPDSYVLYKRNGLIDRYQSVFWDDILGQPYILGDDNYYRVWDADYTIYKDLNLIKCEADINPGFHPNDTTHLQLFYRFNNGQRYADSLSDSLITLINDLQ